MKTNRRGTVQLVVAVVAAVGCVWCWLAAQTTVAVAPITSGEPSTTSVLYDPPLILLALLLAGAAGVLTVLGVASLRRREAPRTHTP